MNPAGSVKVLSAPRMERCIGCHSCSLACARLVHQRLSWNAAGIRVLSSGGLTTGFEARHCLACDPAPCAEACPTGAFQPRRGGGVIVRRRLCIHCGECARACPVDAVYLDSAGEPFTCIHCGRCVAFCPHHCLELEERPAAPKPDAAKSDGAPPAVFAAHPKSGGETTQTATPGREGER